MVRGPPRQLGRNHVLFIYFLFVLVFLFMFSFNWEGNTSKVDAATVAYLRACDRMHLYLHRLLRTCAHYAIHHAPLAIDQSIRFFKHTIACTTHTLPDWKTYHV